MPIDHSKCSHPRTPAGRRACRARHEGMTDSRDLSTTPMGVRVTVPRVSRETPTTHPAWSSKEQAIIYLNGKGERVPAPVSRETSAERGEAFLKKNFPKSSSF